MKELIFVLGLCLCTGIQIDPGFSMMEADSLAPHKKVISKGFKPPFFEPQEIPIFSNKPTHSEDRPLIYDSKRDMYFYGKNLLEAAEYPDSSSPFEKTNKEIIFTLK